MFVGNKLPVGCDLRRLAAAAVSCFCRGGGGGDGDSVVIFVPLVLVFIVFGLPLQRLISPDARRQREV